MTLTQIQADLMSEYKRVLRRHFSTPWAIFSTPLAIC